MQIEQLDAATLKVALSAEEVEYFALDCEALNPRDASTKQALLAVLRHVQRKTRLPIENSKLLIEPFPNETGGCFLLIRLRMEEEEPAGQTTCFPCGCCYRFDSLDAVGGACRRLMEQHFPVGASALYRQEGCYYLHFFCCSRLLSTVRILFSEHGTSCRSGKFLEAHLREHAECLIPTDAIGKIAEVYR